MSLIILGNNTGVDLSFVIFCLKFKMATGLTLINALVETFCYFICVLLIPDAAALSRPLPDRKIIFLHLRYVASIRVSDVTGNEFPLRLYVSIIVPAS